MTTNRRLWIISDLHTDSTDFALPSNPDADILIIAGDIGGRLGGEARLWLERHLPRDIPIIIAPGNHDFYGADIQDETREFWRKTDLTWLWILDGDGPLVIDGIRFDGGTLWTDYRCYTDEYTAQQQGLAHMNDFHRIQIDGRRRRLRPHHLAAIHARHRRSIETTLATPFDGPTVIVTHHAPSLRSLIGGRCTEPLDASYASDLEDLIRTGRPDLWIHGHIHSSRDYMIGDTRIVANPRGQIHRVGTGRNAIIRPENPEFDPLLTIDLNDRRPLATGANIDVAIDRPDDFQWPQGRAPQ